MSRMEGNHKLPAKVFHWGFILLYVYGIFKQIDDISELENSRLLIFEVFFAILFLIIVMMRYFYMQQFETFLGAHEPVPLVHKYIAKIIHKSMYFCLALLPVTGLLIAAMFTQGITDGPIQDSILDLHGFSADLSYILIAIHIGAALYSRIKGEGVWSSMVPLWNEEIPSTNTKIIKLITLENEFFNRVENFISSLKK